MGTPPVPMNMSHEVNQVPADATIGRARQGCQAGWPSGRHGSARSNSVSASTRAISASRRWEDQGRRRTARHRAVAKRPGPRSRPCADRWRRCRAVISSRNPLVRSPRRPADPSGFRRLARSPSSLMLHFTLRRTLWSILAKLEQTLDLKEPQAASSWARHRRGAPIDSACTGAIFCSRHISVGYSADWNVYPGRKRRARDPTPKYSFNCVFLAGGDTVMAAIDRRVDGSQGAERSRRKPEIAEAAGSGSDPAHHRAYKTCPGTCRR